MKEIMLITTKGCDGCSIMRNAIRQALALTKKDGIIFTEIDQADLLATYRKQFNSLKLRDFPTVVFKNDSKILRKEVGTKPYIVVLRWIDIDFK